MCQTLFKFKDLDLLIAKGILKMRRFKEFIMKKLEEELIKKYFLNKLILIKSPSLYKA
jgi:hypothetical protein